MNLKEFLIKRITAAALFAAMKHRDQRRKDAEQSPYINHPLQVADFLASEGVDEEVVLAALLHDTIEDTNTSPAEIESAFGPDVLALVLEVTDDKSLQKVDRKRLQIENTPKKSANAKMIKLADKICNVRDITAASPVGWAQDRKNEYLDWAQKVISGCRGVNESLEAKFDSEISAARARIA
jgi:guanosine-3',5'-bis(diphosphate) 3'-pyrophosphohydrolase